MKIKEILAKIANGLKCAWGWVAADGLLHFALSALILVALGWMGPVPAVFITLLIGFGKEIYDFIQSYRNGLKYDWIHSLHDIICDCLGILFGLVIVFINWLG